MDIEALKKDVNDPLVIASEKGIIIDVNPPFEKLFLWKREEIIGKELVEIMPHEMRDAHQLGFSRFLMTEQPTLLSKPLTLSAIDKNGHIFKAEHIIDGKKQDGKWIFWARIRKLT